MRRASAAPALLAATPRGLGGGVGRACAVALHSSYLSRRWASPPPPASRHIQHSQALWNEVVARVARPHGRRVARAAQAVDGGGEPDADACGRCLALVVLPQADGLRPAAGGGRGRHAPPSCGAGSQEAGPHGEKRVCVKDKKQKQRRVRRSG
jgi:hypothetical protein